MYSRRLTRLPVISIVVPGCYIGWEKYNESRIINTDYAINSPDDITRTLRWAIKTNALKSLTINYEFTRGFHGLAISDNLEQDPAFDEWKKSQQQTNPFWGLILTGLNSKLDWGPMSIHWAGHLLSRRIWNTSIFR